ncbi:Eukaryotic aspartyl protease [Geosmithia morbida]|uniref:Eukaryotic aspartyl protease n=1 Tax=Geosmithia morbida TaxID=1094350 RepID=A0A9P4YZG0_9HYPO|nr:Eukaryotic aspartyl protease [Geosmithia morbida]KAF4124483.1 Eukaryotic aspartyl protease [Geosmithia morbida]
MRSTPLLALAATTLAGHVAVPITRHRLSPPHSSNSRRDDDGRVELEALNNITGGGYYAEFKVGTPPQSISFQLDTGSSDTWVNSVNSDLCTNAAKQRSHGFCMTPLDRGGFDITYLDGRNIKGSYFNDTITIGNDKIENQQLGLASESVRPTGLMGLGFSANVAATIQYPTVVDNMASQGLIDTRAFSLYLNDLEANSGTILFGAIDSQKYIGDLAVLPMSREADSASANITLYSVRISGFDLKDSDGEKSIDIPDLDSLALLDTGSTISLLPEDQVKKLWEKFNVVAVQGSLTPYIDCAFRGEKGTGYVFDFVFDGKTIQVPIEEMVVDAFADVRDLFKQYLEVNEGLGDVIGDWEGVCMFGIGSTSDFDIQFTLLGDTFLRSAYVVYDLDNERIAIAQANLNSSDTNIVDIAAGDLPNITGVKSESCSPFSSLFSPPPPPLSEAKVS